MNKFQKSGLLLFLSGLVSIYNYQPGTAEFVVCLILLAFGTLIFLLD